MIDKIKEKLDNFFDKELGAAVGYVLCGCISNDSFIDKVVATITLFEKEKNCEILERSFISICNEINKLLVCFNQEQDKMKKYDYMILIRGLFSLLEGSVENSLLTKNIINSFKLKWGDGFIDEISNVDRTYLSEDGANYFKKNAYGNVSELDELVKTYLLLKKYQDITHKIYLDLSKNIFKPFSDIISEGQIFKNAFMKEQFIKNNYLNEKLKSKIHTLEEVSKYISFGFGDNVKQVLGGKAFGLGVLYLLNQDVPRTYCIPINYNYDEMDLSIFDDHYRYSVRSSANIEDGEKNSFAGMFDSFLDVEKKDIQAYCKRVLNSVNNQRVIDYIKKFDLNSPIMAVIVQEFNFPIYSGIWMGNGKNTGILEYCKGSGDKIVSGHTVPNREVWDDNTHSENNLKANNIFIGAYLLELQKLIVEKYNALPDFEWCIVNDKIKLLQYRTVTAEISVIPEYGLMEGESVIYGVPCSSGVCEGIAQFIRTPEQLNSLEKGNILLSVFTDPEWLCGMDKAGAIVTAMGGFLCHSAIISRELKIPCITGIGIDNLKQIKDKKIRVNGSNGEILILDKNIDN